MRPIDIIKRRVKELDKLWLNFTYQKSGSVNEMRRVASLVFDHFGLTNKLDVSKKEFLWGPTKYTFLVDGEEVCKYDSFGEPGNPMGHANVMMCIQDMLSHALIKKYPPLAKQIAPLFDTFTTKINWKY